MVKSVSILRIDLDRLSVNIVANPGCFSLACWIVPSISDNKTEELGESHMLLHSFSPVARGNFFPCEEVLFPEDLEPEIATFCELGVWG